MSSHPMYRSGKNKAQNYLTKIKQTIMKTLQNNFTTPEQSKRLLELGVPADSADCFLLRTHTKGDTFIVKVLHDELYSKKDKFTNVLEYLPCWSVGRLMEIAHICSDSTLSYKEEANEIQKFKEEHKCETLIETVIMCITDAVSIGSIDFSKLEE